jgi:hypothetical protein
LSSIKGGVGQTSWWSMAASSVKVRLPGHPGIVVRAGDDGQQT